MEVVIHNPWCKTLDRSGECDCGPAELLQPVDTTQCGVLTPPVTVYVWKREGVKVKPADIEGAD